MAHFYTVLTTFLISTSWVSASLQWKSCTKADSPLHISRIDVSPTPVVIPGDLHVFIDGNTDWNISHSSLSISAHRKTFLFDLPIPCIFHLGSCTYSDICTLLNDFDVNNYAGVTQDLANQVRGMLTANNLNPDLCPNPAKELHINDYVLHLGEVPAILSWFAAGDYNAHITVTDTARNQEILCLDLDITVEQKSSCSGLSCLIG